MLASYPAITALLSTTELDSEHLFSLCLNDRHGPTVLDWYETVYARVLSSDQVTWEGDRRQEVARKLASPAEFEEENAVVLTLARLLSTPTARVVAQAEGKVHGVRTADFLLTAPEHVDVEVCLLNETAVDREIEDVQRSILQRLEAAMRASGSKASSTLRVHVVRSKDGRHVLDPKKEKALVAAAVRLAKQPLLTAVSVGVFADGIVEVEEKRCFSDVLAEIDLRPCTFGIHMSYGGLAPPGGADEAARAVKRKADRKQRQGTRPFVVALHSNRSFGMSTDEIRRGVESRLRGSTSVSAVAVQTWRLSASGIVRPTDPMQVSFTSEVFTNPKARFPISAEVQELFRRGLP